MAFDEPAWYQPLNERFRAGKGSDQSPVVEVPEGYRRDSASALLGENASTSIGPVLVVHPGGAHAVYGHSSGVILVLRAAAAGLPVSRVAAYEPPWAAGDHADRNAATAERLGTLVREG